MIWHAFPPTMIEEIKIKFQQLFRHLDDFVFEKGSPATIALMRIGFGALAFVHLILYQLRFETWFSTNGWLNSNCANLTITPYFSLLNGTRSDAALHVFLLSVTIASLFMTVGFFSRLSTFLTWVGLVSVYTRTIPIIYGGDYTLNLMLLYLCFAQTGECYSIDHILRSSPPQHSDVSLWPQKLIQIQIAFIYLSSFLCKLQDICWTQGAAVYYACHFSYFAHWWIPNAFREPPITTIITYLTLVVEGGLAFLPFFKRFRTPILLCGVMMHLGISYVLFIPFFGLTCVTAYLSFFRGEEIEDFFNRFVLGPRTRRIRLGA